MGGYLAGTWPPMFDQRSLKRIDPFFNHQLPVDKLSMTTIEQSRAVLGIPGVWLLVLDLRRLKGANPFYQQSPASRPSRHRLARKSKWRMTTGMVSRGREEAV